MPCLLALGGFFAPRLILLLLFLTGFLGSAYNSIIWPFLGFFFMPITTLAYAIALHYGHAVSGGYFFLVLMAALADLGVVGGGVRTRRYLPRFGNAREL